MTAKLNILVVDDDIDNALSLGEIFEMEGHGVSVVHSGQEAINEYVKQSFDVAFMDVMMPGKNGVESFMEIRGLRPQAKVYMMTGYSVDELLRQAARGGALGVIEKPFDAAEVLRATQSVGNGGLLVSATPDARSGVGEAIQTSLRQSGMLVRLLSDINKDLGEMGKDEVLVIDANIPLIDEVSAYSRFSGAGHEAATIIVPPVMHSLRHESEFLRNVCSTGILTKPFDPQSLLVRLSALAA
jgi:two-component system, NtrC family, response regulator HydG